MGFPLPVALLRENLPHAGRLSSLVMGEKIGGQGHAGLHAPEFYIEQRRVGDGKFAGDEGLALSSRLTEAKAAAAMSRPSAFTASIPCADWYRSGVNTRRNASP